MLGLGETLDLRRGLLRAVISLRSLEDYYRPIVFSVAGQTTPRDTQQEFDNAFLFLSLPAVAYAVCAVAATDGGAGKADAVDWQPNSSNKMLALPGLLCYYPGCVCQSRLALQLFGRFMSFPPQAPRMPAPLHLDQLRRPLLSAYDRAA